jgi:hypothetical protein
MNFIMQDFPPTLEGHGNVFAVKAPLAISSREACWMAFVAPRILKEPMGRIFSNLR